MRDPQTDVSDYPGRDGDPAIGVNLPFVRLILKAPTFPAPGIVAIVGDIQEWPSGVTRMPAIGAPGGKKATHYLGQRSLCWVDDKAITVSSSDPLA